MYTQRRAFQVIFVTCFKMSIFHIIFVCFLVNVYAAPQHTEIRNDKLAEIPDEYVSENKPPVIHLTDHEQIEKNITLSPELPTETALANNVDIHEVTTPQNEHKEIADSTYPNFSTKFYTYVAVPIKRLIASPKVNTVLRNIGTCMVNGAMELISHFFPTPLMPLIASAAGMIIPFEPVVLLKERMPVTSYRRAIKTAVNSFMDTFDKYKLDRDDDPYMTRQFYRRVMNDDKTTKDK